MNNFTNYDVRFFLSARSTHDINQYRSIPVKLVYKYLIDDCLCFVYVHSPKFKC